VIRHGLVGAVWNIGVSFDGGVVARGVAGIIILHTLRRREPELSASLEAKSPSLGDSSRMACNDGDSLRVMPSTLVGVLSELSVDRRVRITGGDRGFT
jgi:hypothetical protein